MAILRPKFRHELKYLINEGEAEVLRQRFKTVFDMDEHAKNGEYLIRSLYFEDYWNSAYNEKLAGISARRKYRIRIYDYSRDVINLECKIKNESYIYKQSSRITYPEYQSIINGDFDFLLEKDDNLCKEFYYRFTSRCMKAKVIVDYEREPYVMKTGDVRITFDKNVRATSPYFDLFSENVTNRYVLSPGYLIMEVKFSQFLPNIVKRMLQTTASEHTAVSKYVLCCEAQEYLNGIHF